MTAKDYHWKPIVDFLVGLTAIISFFWSLLEKNYVLAWLCFLMFCLAVLFYFCFRSTWQRLNYARQTIEAYTPKFGVADNREIWDSAQKEYQYLGISANTFLANLTAWLLAQPVGDRRTFRFLLLDPDSEAMGHQVCNELNLKAPPNEDVKNDYHDRLAQSKAWIHAGLATLKNTPQFKAGNLTIRLYDDYISWWMHIVDGEHLYLGLLETGRPGIDGPVITFRRISAQYTLFNSFSEHWDRLWNSGKTVI